MTMDHRLAALAAAAAAAGALHSLAPDHWVPFAALARARNWTPPRTARLAFLCGFGHVTVSALFGVLAVILGREALERYGASMQSAAPLLLIGFGAAYMTWGLWRSAHRRLLHQADHLAGVLHDHGHGHAHQHRPGMTEWGLFLLFCADPCIALIPVIVAASGGGWSSVLTVIVAYEIATIAAINILVHAAHTGARQLRFAWIDQHGDAVAGAMMLTVGALVAILGF
jgi:nickel/cobalt transporter (NicO) family protein